MTTALYITEYTDVPVVAGEAIQVGRLPHNASQCVTVTGSNTNPGNALLMSTSVVRLEYFDSAATPTGCYINYDGTATPTAVAATATTSPCSPRIASGVAEYFFIDPLKRGGKFGVLSGT